MKKMIVMVATLVTVHLGVFAQGMVENRENSLLFVGISSSRNIFATVYPATVGFYLGKYLAVGAEYGKGQFEVATGYFKDDRQKGTYETTGAYLRLYPMKTLNFFAGYYQNTWQGDFSLNICTGLDIFCSNPVGQIDTEVEVNTTIATLGISNQWILDFGLTITGDWFAYKSVLSSKKTTSVKANTYSQSLNDDAREEIDKLADDIVSLSGFPGILTLTLSWSF